MPITIFHRVPREDLALGLVRVRGVSAGAAPAALAAELDQTIARHREDDLEPHLEALRKGSRDVLRNGVYRPSGRGKPASEYLLRAARKDDFPRINGLVDANNLVSLRHCVAISVWDEELMLSLGQQLELRLGAEHEQYVFNPAGQTLRLQDLVCGCAIPATGGESASLPMVSPIKDSLATKTRPETTRVMGCVYFPLTAGDQQQLEQITTELLDWLRQCGEQTTGTMAVLLAGQSLSL